MIVYGRYRGNPKALDIDKYTRDKIRCVIKAIGKLHMHHEKINGHFKTCCCLRKMWDHSSETLSCIKEFH